MNTKFSLTEISNNLTSGINSGNLNQLRYFIENEKYLETFLTDNKLVRDFMILVENSIRWCNDSKYKDCVLYVCSKKEFNAFLKDPYYLNLACAYNHIDIFELLLKTHNYELNEPQVNQLLLSSCSGGSVNILKFLIDLSVNKNKVLKSLDNEFIQAVGNGRFEIVKFLLTSNETKKVIHFKNIKKIAMNKSCENGHVDIVKYFIENYDMHPTDNDFLAACKRDLMQVVNYLIFEYNIKETSTIKNKLFNNPYIKELFNLRDVNKKLNKNLTVKNYSSKIIKV